MSGPGFGDDLWGQGAWGGAIEGVLAVVGALASRENVVSLFFSRPVYASGLFDAADAADPSHYAITAVGASRGADGRPARPVRVVEATAVVPPAPPVTAQHVAGQVDLTLDRPLSPYPAVYVVAASGLVTPDLSLLLVDDYASATIAAVFRQVVTPSITTPAPNRDFANPQTAKVLPTDVLGVIRIGDDGDYALDAGLLAYKKRVFRRLITRPGSFVHLGSYGVGVPSYGKRLGLASVRESIAVLAEQQIALEPETAAVRVRLVDDAAPGLVRVQIVARLRGGQALKFGFPFSTQ